MIGERRSAGVNASENVDQRVVVEIGGGQRSQSFEGRDRGRSFELELSLVLEYGDGFRKAVMSESAQSFALEGVAKDGLLAARPKTVCRLRDQRRFVGCETRDVLLVARPKTICLI